MIKLKCHVGIGPVVEGEALVTSDDFSARYDLDRIKGVFSRPAHKLFASPMTAKFWFSIQRKAVSHRPGCCMR